MQYRRDRGDMIEVYKFTHKLYDIEPLLVLDTETRTRGHGYKLKKTRANLGIRQHFFSVRVSDIWNNLPANIVDAPSVNSFRNRLDSYWCDRKYLYEV